MKRFISQFLVVLSLSTIVFAQDEKSQLRLIEEFGEIPTSHWYNFLYGIGQQYKDDKSNLLIKTLGRTGKNIVRPFVWGARMKAHFVGNMNFDSKRIQVQNCDLDREEIKVQIFLVPVNYVVPECNNEIPIPKETFLLSFKGYENPYLETDSIYEIPGAEKAVSDIYYKVLDELLIKSPDSNIFLIGYLGTNHYGGSRLNNKGKYVDFEFRKLDKPKLLKEMLKENQNELVKNGISSLIISSINGGYKDSTRQIEIWFVPKGGEIPKPQPDYFPKKKRQKKN